MKKVAFLLVVVMLLMSSTVVFAAQPEEVLLTNVEEFVRATDSGINVDRKWQEVQKFYGPGQIIPRSIMYNSGGYSGILYFESGFVYTDGVEVWYSGWVYSGDVQPWGLAEY